MKKILLAVVLGYAAVAVAQDTTQPAQAPAQAQPAAGQSAQPVIKDPAEYNAYVAAVQQKDPTARISGLEAFLTQYPNSVMKHQALDVLLGSYQQTGNAKKAVETALKLVAAEPCPVPALFLLTYVNRVNSQGGADANGKQEAADGAKYGKQGLDCLPKYVKPEGTSDAEFQTQVKTMKENFEAGIGWGALQDKDYAKAAEYLKNASEDNPPDSQKDLALLYPLALSYLSQTPTDYQNGIWYAARAAAVAPPANEPGLEKYAKSQYRKFHAGDDGWDEVFAAAKAGGPQVPIKPAPTPAEQAHDMLSKTTPDQMDFGTLEFVLSNGNQADQDTVWNAIKDKPQPAMEGIIISTTPQQFMIAATADDIDAKKADITLNFEEKIPPRMIPKDGATFDFIGQPSSYTPNPFMVVMDKGELVKTKSAAAPAHKTTHKAAQ